MITEKLKIIKLTAKSARPLHWKQKRHCNSKYEDLWKVIDNLKAGVWLSIPDIKIIAKIRRHVEKYYPDFLWVVMRRKNIVSILKTERPAK